MACSSKTVQSYLCSSGQLQPHGLVQPAVAGHCHRHCCLCPVETQYQKEPPRAADVRAVQHAWASNVLCVCEGTVYICGAKQMVGMASLVARDACLAPLAISHTLPGGQQIVPLDYDRAHTWQLVHLRPFRTGLDVAREGPVALNDVVLYPVALRAANKIGVFFVRAEDLLERERTKTRHLPHGDRQHAW